MIEMLANAPGEVAVHVDETLSRWSDVLYGTALGVYAVSVLLLFAGFAASRSLVEVDQRVAAAANADVLFPVEADQATPGRVVPAQRTSGGMRLINMGYAVAIVGMLAHLGSIVTRGIATSRAPWGNMYEFISVTMIACLIGGLIALRAPENRKYLAFVVATVLLLLVINDRFLFTAASPVVPALKSYWLVVHVSIISISSGVLLVSGVASILYLLSLRFGWFGQEAAERLDRVAYRCVVFAFPLFSLGVICGAIWAEHAWGRYWGWDPKEVVSFISWVIYAAYLHARATAGWRVQAAAINVVGFASVLFNLFAINLVIAGLHSYAGV